MPNSEDVVQKIRVFPITEAPVRLHSFLVEVGEIGSQKPLEEKIC